MAAAQIGHLQSWTVAKGKASGKSWPVLTSADPKIWKAKELLQCRRDYWGIEGVFHQRLDATLDEDRSRVRTANGLTVLGLFRRLAVSLATAWLACPRRRRQKKSMRDFQEQLRQNNQRRAFDLVTSLNPMAWNATETRRTARRAQGKPACALKVRAYRDRDHFSGFAESIYE